ncbi:MAG: tetratricopeptide repeat protein, partial [Gemmatimonadetes bacterium]|nr:tetratricopeptide repeat protein [Gemmatimonadota bacterium]
AAGLASADSLIAQDHDSPDAWVARGYLLEQFGDHRLTEARAAFETAISLDPRHVEAHNRLGWVFLALGRDSAALAQARRPATDRRYRWRSGGCRPRGGALDTCARTH